MTKPDETSHRNREKFHHTEKQPEACDCPIHVGRKHEPFTAPLGMSFSQDVGVREISREKACDLYEQHHSYMSGELHDANLAHHGIFYQGQLMGAITYRYGLLGRKRLYFDTEGKLLPRPLSDNDYESLPTRTLQHRARELIPQIPKGKVEKSVVENGGKIVEAARICLGTSMPNLASAGLSKSQELFFRSDNCPDEVEYLISFVRSDYRGSMIRALEGKGWRCVNWTRPSQASNREDKEIREHYKWCYLCPIEEIVKECDQSVLTDW